MIGNSCHRVVWASLAMCWVDTASWIEELLQ